MKKNSRNKLKIKGVKIEKRWRVRAIENGVIVAAFEKEKRKKEQLHVMVKGSGPYQMAGKLFVISR